MPVSFQKFTSKRFDALDAEAFEEMLASRPFAMYQGRLIKELERNQEELERRCDEPTTAFIRGCISMLRVVLGLPGQIHSEMKAPKKGTT
jgi:hypothetical protein